MLSTSTLLVIQPSTTIQKYRYRILVLGGVGRTLIHDPLSNDINSYQTWIYYKETNSWKMIYDVANWPLEMTWFSLMTFCSSRVIIQYPAASNSTWIFLLEQLRLKRVTIVGDGASWTDIGNEFYAVAFESEHSLCSCSQDVSLSTLLTKEIICGVQNQLCDRIYNTSVGESRKLHNSFHSWSTFS